MRNQVDLRNVILVKQHVLEELIVWLWETPIKTLLRLSSIAVMMSISSLVQMVKCRLSIKKQTNLASKVMQEIQFKK